MRQSEKQALRMVAGDLSGLYGMRDLTINDGRGRGMRCLELRSDKGLSCVLLPDRCLDIPYLTYKGMNVGAVTKVGLVSPALYAEDGIRGFLKQFNAGLMTTCGITHAGEAELVEGRPRGLHGSIGNTPAENVSFFETCENDEVVLNVRGDVREACVFEESMVLHRHTRLYTEQGVIEVTDVVENCGFRREPVMNLYHVNVGYPVLDAGARMRFSAPNVEAREEVAASHIDRHTVMEAAEVDRPEECFAHTGGTGFQYGAVYNPRLSVAAAVHYDADTLPILCEWKCCHAGDYALGMEPSVAGYWGRSYAEKNGLMRYLEPGETVTFRFRFEVTEDPARIAELMG